MLSYLFCRSLIKHEFDKLFQTIMFSPTSTNNQATTLPANSNAVIRNDAGMPTLLERVIAVTPNNPPMPPCNLFNDEASTDEMETNGPPVVPVVVPAIVSTREESAMKGTVAPCTIIPMDGTADFCPTPPVGKKNFGFVMRPLKNGGGFIKVPEPLDDGTPYKLYMLGLYTTENVDTVAGTMQQFAPIVNEPGVARGREVRKRKTSVDQPSVKRTCKSRQARVVSAKARKGELKRLTSADVGLLVMLRKYEKRMQGRASVGVCKIVAESVVHDMLFADHNLIEGDDWKKSEVDIINAVFEGFLKGKLEEKENLRVIEWN